MKLVVATLPLAGHVGPTATLVRALVARGHHVTWLSGAAVRTDATLAGADFGRLHPLPDLATGTLQEWAARCERCREGQAANLAPYLADADVLVADPTITGAETAWLRSGVPYVCLGILPLLHARPEWPLFVQATIADLEYPRPDLKNLALVGPLLPALPAWTPPPWWEAITKPLVFVTQGTLAAEPADLILPALDAFAGLDVTVVTACDPGKIPASRIPPNAHLAPFLPYGHVIPRAACVVTNGGYVGVQMAMAAGRPLIVAGGTEEKGEIAKRVAWAGIGIDLGTQHPDADMLRAALLTLAVTPRYQERAQQLAARAQRTDAAETTALLLEHLAPQWAAERAA